MVKDFLHEKICENYNDVQNWFKNKSDGMFFPFSSSYDIRESEFKVAPVDANLFPAGFNNICQVDQDSANEIVKKYFSENHQNISGMIALVCEAHTKNAYYWQNVSVLLKMLSSTGNNVKLAIPSEEPQSAIEVETVLGEKLEVNFIYKKDKQLLINNEAPELLISNNDFSTAFTSWTEGFSQEMNPPLNLGWHNRSKISFFNNYNQLVEEFAKVIGVSAEILKVNTIEFADFDINSEESRKDLSTKAEEFMTSLKSQYSDSNINEEPFIFVKNSSGTYGLGVKQVNAAEDILSWSYKDRKKMKAVKGGGSINKVIIQEGIPTVFTNEDETAEPTIYMIGDRLIGGFIRAHSKKGPRESLNSPGAVYKKLCVSDLKVRVVECPMENVYGWVSKLASLAVAQEIQLGSQ